MPIFPSRSTRSSKPLPQTMPAQSQPSAKVCRADINLIAIYRTREVNPDMAVGFGKRILVTETIGDKRNVPRAPRTCGECAAGGSDYQHRLFPIH